MSARARQEKRREQIEPKTANIRASSNRSKLRIRQLRLAELPVNTIELARFLIGKIVVHDSSAGRMSGRIVETEAYPPGDPAGHHFRGPTPRNRSLFLRHGHCYVYFTYGNHFMLNVSSEGADVGGGVLIRALEPLEGIAIMERNRGTTDQRDLTRGPGRLAEALDIDRRYDGIDLCEAGPLRLGAMASRKAQKESIGITVRIGITKAVEQPFRFFVMGSPFVSGPRRLVGEKGSSRERSA